MKLNRKWLLVIALVMSLTLATAGTLAYLTDRDTVENTFTLGNVDIEVEEVFPDGGAPIKPGEEVNKDAQITNEGANPAWVWMTVSIPETLVDYVTPNWANGFEPVSDTPEIIDGQAVWTVLVEDQLPAGESTEYILDSVTLSPLVDYQGGEYVVVEDGAAVPLEGVENGSFIVTVNGYATQVDEFDTVEDAYAGYQGQWTEKLPNGIYSLQDLIDACNAGGEYVLCADLDITEDNAIFRSGRKLTAVMKDMTLDLNNHDISVDLGNGEYADAGNPPTLFYVYTDASLTIKGDGNLSASNDACLIWVTSKSTGAYIYGGNYSNDNFSTGNPAKPTDSMAIIYSSGGTVNVYGGTFTYEYNSSNDDNTGFNLQDTNNYVDEIILHEGVLLSCEAYAHGDDKNKINLATGCELQEVEIDGVTWYRVTKLN